MSILEKMYFSDMSTPEYLAMEVRWLMADAQREWKDIAAREGYYCPPDQEPENTLRDIEFDW